MVGFLPRAQTEALLEGLAIPSFIFTRERLAQLLNDSVALRDDSHALSDWAKRLITDADAQLSESA